MNHPRQECGFVPTFVRSSFLARCYPVLRAPTDEAPGFHLWLPAAAVLSTVSPRSALRALAVEFRATFPPFLHRVGGLGPLMTQFCRGHSRFCISIILNLLEPLVLAVEDSFKMLPRGLFSLFFQHSSLRESIQDGDVLLTLFYTISYPLKLFGGFVHTHHKYRRPISRFHHQHGKTDYEVVFVSEAARTVPLQ